MVSSSNHACSAVERCISSQPPLLVKFFTSYGILPRPPGSVSEKMGHAPSRPAPPGKNVRNSLVVPREARLHEPVRHYSDGLLGDNDPFAMADHDPESPLSRSAKALQRNAEQAGPAAGASYTLIGAIIVLGGIGYAVDSWRGTSPWFLIGGLMLGIAVGMYELAKTVWHK